MAMLVVVQLVQPGGMGLVLVSEYSGWAATRRRQANAEKEGLWTSPRQLRSGRFQFISYDLGYKNVVATLMMPVKLVFDKTTDPYSTRDRLLLLLSSRIVANLLHYKVHTGPQSGPVTSVAGVSLLPEGHSAEWTWKLRARLESARWSRGLRRRFPGLVYVGREGRPNLTSGRGGRGWMGGRGTAWAAWGLGERGWLQKRAALQLLCLRDPAPRITPGSLWNQRGPFGEWQEVLHCSTLSWALRVLVARRRVACQPIISDRYGPCRCIPKRQTHHARHAEACLPACLPARQPGPARKR